MSISNEEWNDKWLIARQSINEVGKTILATKKQKESRNLFKLFYICPDTFKIQIIRRNQEEKENRKNFKRKTKEI
jgi:hypothetical protein